MQYPDCKGGVNSCQCDKIKSWISGTQDTFCVVQMASIDVRIPNKNVGTSQGLTILDLRSLRNIYIPCISVIPLAQHFYLVEIDIFFRLKDR